MSALALYFEEAGLSTVCIALVREHAEKVAPPRALWVPFSLGRPFGPPHDSALQRQVILSAFELLAAEQGPVLEDFPDVGSVEATQPDAAWVCPVSFPPAAPKPGDRLSPVLDEIRALSPWYDRAVEQRGRTTVGISGHSVDDAARVLVERLQTQVAVDADAVDAVVDEIRWSADDMKAFYYEAVSAQTGYGTQSELEQWFWTTTRAGQLLRDVGQACLAAEQAALRDVGNFMLVPGEYQ